MVSTALASPQVRRAPASANLYDILDLILDKGIVIDAFVRVSVVGIELITVDLRVVIASVDTYLRYAEAVERLGLRERSGSVGLPDLVGDEMTNRAVSRGVHRVKEAITGGGSKDHTGARQRNGRHAEAEDAGQEDDGVVETLGKGAKAVAAGALGATVAKGVSKLAAAVTGGNGSGGKAARKSSGSSPRGRKRTNSRAR